MELAILVFASLFSVVNPLGAVPVFLSLTPHYTRQHRRSTSLHTSIYFSIILLSFFFAGSYILSFFGISLNALRIAGGLVILHSGYSLLSGNLSEGRAVNKKVKQEAMVKDDISFAPMAMPMLSGPGSISLLIGLYAEYTQWPDRFVIAGGIIFTGLIVFLILRASPNLFRLLGVGGIKAISRIMGFIVMAIGIQYIILGVLALVNEAM